MEKLKLVMDELRVDSFATSEAGGERGTVNGHGISIYNTNLGSCGINTGGCNSCAATCIAGACASENQTYIESCVAGACPNSYDQLCNTRFYPVQPPPTSAAC
jgi:hypothetical protein